MRVNIIYNMCTVRKLCNSSVCSYIKIISRKVHRHSFDGADENKDNELNVGKFGSFTIFRINRPEKRNCLNYSTAVKLKEALNKFNDDLLSSVGVIVGEGGNFCSGLDLNELANDSKFYQKFSDLRLTDEFSKKPIIAAINGYAVGTGFDLALWCDLRVVEDTAIFGYFNQRFGVPLSEGNVKRLIQLVGRARAIDWVLTGRIVRANEAFQAGIASRLVACGTAFGQSVALAKNVAKYPFSSTLLNRINLHSEGFSEKEQVRMFQEKDILIPSLEEKIPKMSKKFVDGFGRHGKSTDLK